ncbi:MAG: potassium channel family protein [Truepera sp.]|nr:potassium channel family protein [Truepera sp.]
MHRINAMNIGQKSFGRLRFFWLLVALLLLIVLGPVAEVTGLGGVALLILFSLLLLASAYVASERLRGLIAAVGLTVPWAVLTWFRPFAGDVANALVADGLAISLLLYTLSLLLHRIVAVKESNFDILCAAAAVYLLIGVVWGVWFRFIETLVPGSFVLTGTGEAIGWSNFIYFSLATLTTLGYGDITPVSPVARVWATLEAVAGVLYVALLISRLVSLYRR